MFKKEILKNGKTKKISIGVLTAIMTVSMSISSFADVENPVFDRPDGVFRESVSQNMFAPPGGTNAPMGMPPGGGPQSAVTEWSAVQEYTEDATVDDLRINSTGADENAVHVFEGSEVILNNPSLTRKSSDSSGGDSSSFYGVGAALLTTEGTSYVNGGTITTDSAGGAGVFAYDSGVSYVQNTKISTAQDTSGGIHVAGGGTLYAWDVDATTQGESSAAIRSDRGGGTMVVNGGTYTSNGVGSPALYCTADISVKDAALTANGSEGICLEGLNTTRLFNCDLTSNMSDNEQNDTTWSVIVYQSMSGDSEVGVGTFDMIGGSLTSKNGGLFYTTNTESNFYLSGVDITAADDSEFFLRATGNNNKRGWGTSGANGATCSFTANDQAMEGDVIYDSISKLDFYMLGSSTLKGSFIDDESCAGEGGSDGYAKLYISKDSTWTVSGDSTLKELQNEGTIADLDGKSVTIKGTDGTVYQNGDGNVTVTVESYLTSADTQRALSAPEWSDYETAKPIELSQTSGASDTANEQAADNQKSDDSQSQESAASSERSLSESPTNQAETIEDQTESVTSSKSAINPVTVVGGIGILTILLFLIKRFLD